MKKLLCLLLGCLILMCGFVAYAGNSLQITLSKGWNVVSTPAILSSITFSNGGNGISFSKLQNGQWVTVPANVTNITPLEGYMVYNNTSSDVTMTLKYKTGVTASQSLLQKNLNYGWNFLGIVTTSNPFNNITGANMSVDFTNNGSTNFRNKINSSYQRNTSSKNIASPQIGEAYGIFVNENQSIYGGVNNGGEEISDDNTGNNGGNENNNSILNNMLNDITLYIYGGNIEGYDTGRLDDTIFYGGKVQNIMIASGTTNVDTSERVTFAIKTNEAGAESMTLLIGNRGYQGAKTKSGSYYIYTFDDVIINSNEKFCIYFKLPSDNLVHLTRGYLDYSVVDNQIPGFNLRKINAIEYLYRLIDKTSPDFIYITDNEIHSEIIYDGVYEFYGDFTIDKMQSTITGPYRIYFNNVEVLNSSMTEFSVPRQIEEFSISSGDQLHIKVVKDISLDNIQSNSNIRFYGIVDNGIRYYEQITMSKITTS